MPLIRVTSSGEPLSIEQRRELGRELTDVLLEIEGGARTDRARSLAYVMFEHLADESWTVGGDMGDTYYPALTRLMARVDVPAGSLDSRGKQRAIEATFTALAAAVPGSVSDEGWAPWVIITEVPEGNWGGSGKPRGLGDIAEHAGISPEIVNLIRTTVATAKGA
jgi:phenylpyruvate tautomerase PptA (4-oxalocrotonate tautomerase family)